MERAEGCLARAKESQRPAKKHLVLRCCPAGGMTRNSFRWPVVGPLPVDVEAPDWDPTPECGGGLHGWLDGCGDVRASDCHADPDAVWMVLEVEADIVDLDGKVKFPRCRIIRRGPRGWCVAYVCAQRPHAAVVYAAVSVGDHGTVSAGDYGTASAGDYGTASVGDYGTASVGDHGTALASYGGTASAGDHSSASAGAYGTASAGAYGTASVGVHGFASAGYGGEIRIRWNDGSRYRLAVGYVGEDGIRANTPYKVIGGKLVEVKEKV